MARKYVYGIIPIDQPMSFGVSGFPPRPEAVYTVVHRGLGCVVSNYSGEEFTSLTKEEKIRCLMAHQAVIERVMNDYPVLPVKFGTLLEGDDEVCRLLEQGHQTFTEALAKMDGKVEMEVAASWDLKRVLEEIGREEEIVRLKESIANRPAAETLEQQIQAGKIVKQSLDRRREEYQQRMQESLRGAALDVQPNALVADEMVMNVAFLIPREREGEFEQRVRELDQAFHDQINFRIIGPLPPYSFATVEVARPSAEKIEEARQLLGLGVAVSEAEAKQAYRRLAAATHPDANPEGEQGDERFARVREAFALLTAYCQGQDQAGGPATEKRRFSLAPKDVSQAFLVNVRRAAAPGGVVQ
ncbi:MAG: GvpL/GvpF family gas vesicle protein [Anaerolineae bacterium]